MQYLAKGHAVRPHQPEQSHSTQAVPESRRRPCCREVPMGGFRVQMPQKLTRNSCSKPSMQTLTFHPTHHLGFYHLAAWTFEL